VTIVIYPLDGESLADFMQRQAPEGWTIIAVKHAFIYRITTNDGLTAIVSSPELAPGWRISDGWQLKILDTGVATEFTVTTPDGRELWFHDCWHP
jgi:hypothetical protein